MPPVWMLEAATMFTEHEVDYHYDSGLATPDTVKEPK